MVQVDADYAAFRKLHRLRPKHREPEPLLSDEAKAALEKRLEKYQLEQESRIYNEMVKNVIRDKDVQSDEFGAVWKEMNRQGTVVFNTMLTVGGAFTFAYYGAPMMVPSLDLPYRVVCGLILGAIVFFADLYFIMKSM
uniref:Transmembrane protein 199 n=1 Tax=Panagrellus redivivus TaxID=6233 RepID=A0A7E4ZY64_PANRE